MATIDVLVPVPPADAERTSTTYALDRSLTGVRVGLRLDPAWRAYETVLGVWTAMLEDDGASVHRLVTGERVGPTAQQTRDDIDAWARLVEVGVVGLGN